MQINVTTDIGLVSLLNVYLPTDYRDMNSLDEFSLLFVLDDISCSTCYYGIIGIVTPTATVPTSILNCQPSVLTRAWSYLM